MDIIISYKTKAFGGCLSVGFSELYDFIGKPVRKIVPE